MGKYIDRQAAIDELCNVDEYNTRSIATIKDMKPADVVSWAYLERYANWFCADISFPEFIREAKAFLKASGGFQERNKIYG